MWSRPQQKSHHHLKIYYSDVLQALRRNPFAPEVPCHRVIAASLDLGGFSGQWGPTTPNVCRKRELLATEGVRFDEAGHLLDKGTCLDVTALQAIAGQKGLKKEP